MILCSACNAPNRPEARFCGNCRVPLNVCPKCSTANRAGAGFCHGCSQLLKVSCPVCSRVNRAGASFCSQCGTSLIVRARVPVLPSVRCPVCGSGNRAGARFCLVCGSPQPSQPAPRPRYGTGLLPPSTLVGGRYLVLQKIAQGGQGAVYKVSDTHSTSRLWAMKEMSESVIAPSERQQVVDAFRREAELLATLDHCNLPKVIDLFEEHGRQYMVMEFVDGKTLFKLLEESAGPLPVDRVLDWAEQICDVLGYLHSQVPPVIYRDLKPQNVMEVTKTHDVKLIDFGIVRFYKAGQRKDTVLLGTPGYAPPEQFGKGQTDARADVYALGATLHFLLTRRDPATDLFRFPSVQSLNQSVPREVDDAITKAVRVRAEDRFVSMEEMSHVLLGKRKRRVPLPKAMRQPQPSPAVADQDPVHTDAPIFSSPGARAMPAPIPSMPAFTPSPAFPAVIHPLLPTRTNGLTLSDHHLDFGLLCQGSSESQRLHVALGPGATGQVFSHESWISVTPATLQSGSEDVNVTVNTGSLALSNHSVRAVPNWIQTAWAQVRQRASGGGKALASVVLLFPVWVVALLGIALGQTVLWLAFLHARYLVPAPSQYRGTVMVEASPEREEVEIEVTVEPTTQGLTMGWLKVAGAMLVELSLMLLPLAWLLGAKW